MEFYWDSEILVGHDTANQDTEGIEIILIQKQ